jgi:hypothetical protein
MQPMHPTASAGAAWAVFMAGYIFHIYIFGGLNVFS